MIRRTAPLNGLPKSATTPSNPKAIAPAKYSQAVGHLRAGALAGCVCSCVEGRLYLPWLGLF